MENNIEKKVRRPGIEPGSTAWKAAMLTTIPPTPRCFLTAMWHTVQDQLIALAFFLPFVLIMIRVIKLRVLS